MTAAEFISLKSLLDTRKMTDDVLFVDGPLVSQVSEEAFAVLKADYARLRVREWRVKFTQQGPVVDHLTEFMHLPATAALDQFPANRRGPLLEVTGAAEVGGH